jgi:ketosteroid isomerase-like protein
MLLTDPFESRRCGSRSVVAAGSRRENQRREPVKDVCKFREGQIYQKHEYEDQVEKIDHVPVRFEP